MDDNKKITKPEHPELQLQRVEDVHWKEIAFPKTCSSTEMMLLSMASKTAANIGFDNTFNTTKAEPVYWN